MNLLVFGSSSFASQVFNVEILKSKLFKKENIYFLSRLNKGKSYFDLTKFDSFNKILLNKPTVIVSFAPIWLVDRFFKNFLKNDINLIRNIKFLLITSSTSAITKKYSFNEFDKNLSKKLSLSESSLRNFCQTNSINIRIIRTALIYGRIRGFKDKNIEIINKLMQKLPFILIPINSGLRQPIHIKQLSDVYINLIKESNYEEEIVVNKINNIGGDEILNYYEILLRIKNSKVYKSEKNNCFILRIPNRIFYLLFFPIYLFSPKIYESLLRISCDLSNFDKAYILSNKDPKSFPLDLNS